MAVFYRFRFRYACVLSLGLAAAMLFACGNKKSSVAPVGRGLRAPPISTPVETTLADALSELDALKTPEGVDPALFAELKNALKEALHCRAGGSSPAFLGAAQRPRPCILEELGRPSRPKACEPAV
jgi:hypothetical protein